MSLNEPTQKNMNIIVNEIAEHLQVVNRSIMKPEDFDLEKYSELKSLRDMLVAKGNLSVAETQAFIEELASLRK
ncbi:DUF1128 domain-containing protein [Sediminibacillus massiliensis]|uniref:DUF1128 domain-containing protein n=1 Tax=Sediminibacillus massiliensis TaxID=1926277 RepID=UPI000988495C|nr:DUF1128 domain-containing protein [Sediminibacillus massiliensis]